MNIGLLTHHWPPNFGANLQAFSTVRALERMGHSVYVLNYRPHGMADRYKLIVRADQIDQHEMFIQEHMNETQICTNREDLVEVSRKHKIECVICGSDAVLRLQVDSDREDLKFPNPFWLAWVDEGVRVGFLAASCMGSQYYMLPKKVRCLISDAVRELDYCSVRDKWSRWMLRVCGVSGDQVNHCPDPVVGIHEALEGLDISRPDGKEEPYILVSLYPGMLSEAWVVEFVDESNRLGYQVFGLPQPDVDMQGPYNKILPLPMSPLDWYRWISNASGYVGVRFHPVMLSQVNNVPYVALDTYDVGIQIQTRFLRPFGRVVWPLLRCCSKTYDASKRVAKQKYCIPSRWFRRITPTKVLSLLEKQREESKKRNCNYSRKKLYFDTLKKIVGQQEI